MSSPALATARVAVLIVSHDGARWLPGVLEGLAEQELDGRVIAVDTGSLDGSAALLAPVADVVTASSSTSYPAAVRMGLERLEALEALGPHGSAPGGDAAHDWVWLLHDDSRPAPGALAALLAAARDRPDVDVLGPKLREWPSLARLLELGVTISGTGRRETGLERGEYDQGQHDDQREVLAVNTAGMLVRRRVLEELGGFDEHLPVFGNDLDFGWRAASAGHTTLVVPEAVVFHAEAAHRGLRRTSLTGRHTHYQERRAALYTLLVNSSARALPWRVVRLVLGTLLRMIGFLALRSVGEALDDLAALLSVLSRPGTIVAARRDRRTAAVATHDPGRARALLAPAWVPYRHGLDFVGDLAAAVTNQAADVAERRRIDAAQRDPSSSAARRLRAERDLDEDEELADTGLVARYLSDPIALVLTAVVVVALVGTRTAWGTVVGGALAPVPSGAGAWWSLALDAWHPLGFGTDVPAPPYVVVLALLASVLGTTATVSLLMLGAVPFGLWGAWRFLRVAGRLVSPLGAPRWLLVVAASTYALVPITSGAWGTGRLGLVVTAALVPWVAHAALGFADPEPERRWRAAWRTGLLLALAAAFSPVAWWLATSVTAVVLVLGLLVVRSALLRRDVIGPPLASLAAPAALLAPWWVGALRSGAAGLLVAESGRQPGAQVGTLDVLSGRLEGGAPVWSGVLLLVLAALALVPRATRIPVALCWLVVLVSVVLAAVLSGLSLDLVALSGPAGLGTVVVVVQAALVTAALLGAQGLVRDRAPAERGARTRVALRAAGLVAAGAAVLVPAAGLVWTVDGDDLLGSEPAKVVPAYMLQSSVTGPEHGILVVRGTLAGGLSYTVRRDDGVTLGEDEVLAFTPTDAAAQEAVATVLARPTSTAVSALGDLGLEWILITAPADGSVAASLDATTGLVQASTDPGTRAWRVDRPMDPAAVDGPGSAVHVALLVVQGLSLLLVLVLCAPTLRGGRES